MSRKNKTLRAFLHQNQNPTIEQAWDAAWERAQKAFHARSMQDMEERLDAAQAEIEALQAERDAAFALLRECQLILREECGARIDYVELNAFLKGNASAMDILAALDDTAGGSHRRPPQARG